MDKYVIRFKEDPTPDKPFIPTTSDAGHDIPPSNERFSEDGPKRKKLRKLKHIKCEVKTSEPIPKSSSPPVSIKPLPLSFKKNKIIDEVDCGICLTTIQSQYCHSFSCGHLYCEDCLNQYFKIQIMDKNVHPINCPEPFCDSAAHPDLIRRLVPEEVFKHFDERLLNNALELMDDIFFCPKINCHSPVVLDDGQPLLGICNVCEHAFCTNCNSDFHGVSDCMSISSNDKELLSTYIKSNKKYKKIMKDKYGQKLKTLIEEDLTKKWKKKRSKSCPTCKSAIEKIDGCNKIICWKCQTKFCWLCAKPLPESNPYLHFNEPGGSCILFNGAAYL